jgi:hypothetical protein
MSPQLKKLQRKYAWWAVPLNAMALIAIIIFLFDRKNPYFQLAGTTFILISMIINVRGATVIKRIRRRIAEGRCCYCSYDLRASSAICPECGNPIQPSISCTRCKTVNLADEGQCWKCDRSLAFTPPPPEAVAFLESAFDKPDNFKQY